MQIHYFNYLRNDFFKPARLVFDGLEKLSQKSEITLVDVKKEKGKKVEAFNADQLKQVEDIEKKANEDLAVLNREMIMTNLQKMIDNPVVGSQAKKYVDKEQKGPKRYIGNQQDTLLVQAVLKETGHYIIPLDKDDFGRDLRETRKSVEAFQRDYNKAIDEGKITGQGVVKIGTDGWFGPDTFEAIKKYLAYKDGEKKSQVKDREKDKQVITIVKKDENSVVNINAIEAGESNYELRGSDRRYLLVKNDVGFQILDKLNNSKPVDLFKMDRFEKVKLYGNCVAVLDNGKVSLFNSETGKFVKIDDRDKFDSVQKTSKEPYLSVHIGNDYFFYNQDTDKFINFKDAEWKSEYNGLRENGDEFPKK